MLLGYNRVEATLYITQNVSSRPRWSIWSQTGRGTAIKTNQASLRRCRRPSFSIAATRNTQKIVISTLPPLETNLMLWFCRSPDPGDTIVLPTRSKTQRNSMMLVHLSWLYPMLKRHKRFSSLLERFGHDKRRYARSKYYWRTLETFSVYQKLTQDWWVTKQTNTNEFAHSTYRRVSQLNWDLMVSSWHWKLNKPLLSTNHALLFSINKTTQPGYAARFSRNILRLTYLNGKCFSELCAQIPRSLGMFLGATGQLTDLERPFWERRGLYTSKNLLCEKREVFW